LTDISNKPWGDFPNSAFTDEQFIRSCVLDRGPDAGTAKQRCSLPILEPDGTLNRNAVHNATARINQVGEATADQKHGAARKLIAAYKQLGEEPPDSLKAMAAGEDRSRPTAGQLEERSIDTAGVDGRRLRGLIPYGVESRDLGGWREVIDRGALRNTRLDDLIATREHDRAHLLGRYPTTLAVEDRSDGFAWSVDLPSSPVGEDVRVAVDRGDLRSTSWRMIVSKDRWAGDVRHVTDIAELRDVTVTAAPAYGDEARCEYRSLSTTAEEAAMTATQAPEAVETPETTTTPEDRSEAATQPEDRSQPLRRGLRVEDRSANPPPSRPIEERIIDAMRAVPPGECRSLTEPNLSLVAPPELSTFLWDYLRPESVVLESGVTVIVTDRASVKWPRQTGDPTVGFYNELDAITESDPTFDELDVTVKAIKALVIGSSEAFEDSSPDLLTLLEANLNKILALKVDAAFLFGTVSGDPKGFDGMDATAATSISWGSNTNWDPIISACGYLAGAHVPPPYHLVLHPWADTYLSLIKQLTGTDLQSNAYLPVPDSVPPRSTTSLIPVDSTHNTSTAYVYAPKSIGWVRRRDVVIEVDRSEEFSNDAILVRGKLRGAPAFPYPQAIVKIAGVPTPNPAPSS